MFMAWDVIVFNDFFALHDIEYFRVNVFFVCVCTDVNGNLVSKF